MAVDVYSGDVDRVGSDAVSGEVDAEFESAESSGATKESTDWTVSLPEAQLAAIDIEAHTNKKQCRLPITDSNVHGDLNFLYLCVV